VEILNTLLKTFQMAYDSFDNVPSATVNVKIDASAQHLDLIIQTEAYAHSQFFSLSACESYKLGNN
jgi:hypothetical protein